MLLIYTKPWYWEIISQQPGCSFPRHPVPEGNQVRITSVY